MITDTALLLRPLSRVLLLLLALTPSGACSSDPDNGNRDLGQNDQLGADLRPDAPGCSAGPMRQYLDLAYGDQSRLLKKKRVALDIFVPARQGKCTPAPVVVWVHGGGWSGGDKANAMEDKISLFNGLGYLFVSVNYRLSPTPPAAAADRVKHPIHVQDVARALDWILDNISAGYGGDVKQIAVLGHSAGAHLAALVATDGARLAAHGHKLSALACVGSLDTQALDVAAVMKAAKGDTKTTYENAFGTDAATWKQASPITHVAAGKGIPPFLLVQRGTAARRAILASFVAALKTASVESTIIDGSSLTHAEVKEMIGKSGDTVMTPPLLTFLKSCFGG